MMKKLVFVFAALLIICFIPFPALAWNSDYFSFGITIGPPHGGCGYGYGYGYPMNYGYGWNGGYPNGYPYYFGPNYFYYSRHRHRFFDPWNNGYNWGYGYGPPYQRHNYGHYYGQGWPGYWR